MIKAGLFDETLPSCQDYDMWVRLISSCGPAGGVNSTFQLMYQDHGKNRISTKSYTKFKGYFMFYKKHKYKKFFLFNNQDYIANLNEDEKRYYYQFIEDGMKRAVSKTKAQAKK